MKKEELKKLRPLYATDNLIRLAMEAKPEKKRLGCSGTEYLYQYDVYMRCRRFGKILKVAFFLARDLRLGCRKPVYELYINKKTSDFLTWDALAEKWRTAMVDNLTWTGCDYQTEFYIKPSEDKMIQQYLGVSKGGLPGILAYQNNIRETRLEARHKRETDAWDQMMKQVPALPKDWGHWVDKQGLHENYIFYDYARNGAKEGYCTWCEKMVPIDSPKHNKEGICKCCGHKIQYKTRGRAGSFCTKEENVYLLQRCRDGFVLRQFLVNRYYRKGEYESPERCCKEEQRIIYDRDLKESIFHYGWYKWKEYRWVEGPFTGFGLGFYNTYRTGKPGEVYRRTVPSLACVELKKTGLPEFIQMEGQIQPENYLNVLKKKPYLEQIIKAGLSPLVKDVYYRSETLKVGSGNSLAKMLCIDGNRLRRLRDNDGGYQFLSWLQFEKESGREMGDSLIQFFMEHGIEAKDIQFISDRMGEQRIYNYLQRQYRVSGRKPKELLSTWQDYLSMAKRLKRNVTLELIYKPKDLLEAHNEMIKLCEINAVRLSAEEVAEKYPDVNEICKSLKEKYEFQDERYMIIAPSGIEDIINEGRALRHCTSWCDIYYGRIQSRESFLMFLRKADKPDQPFYTLEIEPDGTARQKRTTGDKQDQDFEEAVSFLKTWQQVIQKRLTKEDYELAEMSAGLRKKELKKLREDKAKIWHGHLAGQLLADVLEADLLEVERSKSEESVVQLPQRELEMPAVA